MQKYLSHSLKKLQLKIISFNGKDYGLKIQVEVLHLEKTPNLDNLILGKYKTFEEIPREVKLKYLQSWKLLNSRVNLILSSGEINKSPDQ